MGNITVNLDGVPTEIKRLKIPLKQLILDIENPRIQYYLDTRLNDDITQGKIKFALAEGNDQYKKLKKHIELQPAKEYSLKKCIGLNRDTSHIN